MLFSVSLLSCIGLKSQNDRQTGSAFQRRSKRFKSLLTFPSKMNSMDEDGSLLRGNSVESQNAREPEIVPADPLLTRPVLNDVTNVFNSTKSYLGYQNRSGIVFI